MPGIVVGSLNDHIVYGPWEFSHGHQGCLRLESFVDILQMCGNQPQSLDALVGHHQIPHGHQARKHLEVSDDIGTACDAVGCVGYAVADLSYSVDAIDRADGIDWYAFPHRGSRFDDFLPYFLVFLGCKKVPKPAHCDVQKFAQ